MDAENKQDPCELIGECDICDGFIFADEDYYEDDDSPLLCPSCKPSLRDCVQSMLNGVMKNTKPIPMDDWTDDQVKDAGNWAGAIMAIVQGDCYDIPTPPDILRVLMEPVDFFVLEAGAKGYDKVFSREVLDSWSAEEKAEVFHYISAKVTDVMIEVPAPDCIVKLYSHPKEG